MLRRILFRQYCEVDFCHAHWVIERPYGRKSKNICLKRQYSRRIYFRRLCILANKVSLPALGLWNRLMNLALEECVGVVNAVGY